MQVQVVFAAAARQVWVCDLDLPAGATAQDAIARSGVLAQFAQFEHADLTFAIWNRPCDAGTVLREGDRLELLRALTVDPKLARRTRFQQQGARATGLFARRRPGAKAGY